MTKLLKDEVLLYDRTNWANMSMAKLYGEGGMRSNDRRTYHGFSVIDRLGREIGAIITVGSFTTTELPPGYDDGQKDENRYVVREATPLPTLADRRLYVPVGTFYSMHATAARAGKAYGAGHSTRYFTTVEGRDAVLAKYLNDARKRAIPGK